MASVKKKKEFNKINSNWNLIFTIILIAIAVIVVAPVVLVVVISFSSTASIMKVGYNYIPAEWSLEGYYYVFKMGRQFFVSYLVTIIHSVLGTVSSVFVMAMFAYTLAQKKFAFRRVFTWYMFFPMLFSGGMVANYIFFVRYYNLYDSFFIYILPSLVASNLVIILRTFISTTIPEGLFDAARIDGAGHFTVFVKVVLPLAKAGLATVGLFTFVGRWNDWFTGFMYIQNPNLVPIQTLLTRLNQSVDYLKQNAGGIESTPEGLELLKKMPSDNLRMACTVLVIAPMLFTYPFFQRYFISGLTVGSIKG